MSVTPAARRRQAGLPVRRRVHGAACHPARSETRRRTVHGLDGTFPEGLLIPNAELVAGEVKTFGAFSAFGLGRFGSRLRVCRCDLLLTAGRLSRGCRRTFEEGGPGRLPFAIFPVVDRHQLPPGLSQLVQLLLQSRLRSPDHALVLPPLLRVDHCSLGHFQPPFDCWLPEGRSARGRFSDGPSRSDGLMLDQIGSATKPVGCPAGAIVAGPRLWENPFSGIIPAWVGSKPEKGERSTTTFAKPPGSGGDGRPAGQPPPQDTRAR